MNESLRHSLKERRHGRNRAIGAPIAPFRSVFALEEDQSSQIYPRTSGQRPQLVLPLASVAGLVVPGVEAELEDGGFDVVPFVLLFLGDVLHQLSGAHRFQLLGEEVPPLVLGSVARIRYAERSASGPLGLIDLPGPRVGDSDRITVALVQQVTGLSSLNAGEHTVHFKRPVVGILVGPVAVDRVHPGPGSGLALGDGIFVEGVVRGRGALHLHAGDQSRRIRLVRGLGDVHAVALHLLPSLLAVLRLRVVRVLDAARRDGLFVSGCNLTVFNHVLFLEHLLEKSVLGLHPHQNSINDASQFAEPLQDGLGVALVNGLLGVLLQTGLNLFLQGGVETAHVLSDLLEERLVDKLIAGVPCDVAADKLAVHTDCATRDLELRGLEASQAAEAGLHQVLPGGIRVVTDAPAEQVVGVQGRRLVLHLDQTERLAGEKVVVALLHQVLVGAAIPLLEDGHRHQPADGCRRCTHVALLEQRLKDGLVNLGCDQTEELVEPGLGIFILLRCPLAHQVGRVVKQGHLGVYVGLSEHGNLLSELYAS